MATFRLTVQTVERSFFEDYPTREEAQRSLDGLDLGSGSKQGFVRAKNGGFVVSREHIIGAQIDDIGDYIDEPSIPANPIRDDSDY